MVDSEGLEREDCTGMRRMRLACCTYQVKECASRHFSSPGPGPAGWAHVSGGLGWLFSVTEVGGCRCSRVDPDEVSGTDCVCV